MDIIAHRGWSEKYPENTHAAFAAALTTGCQGLEFDVRLSVDGVVVVTHDADLSRFGGTRLPVSQQTLAQLRAVYPLPTLAEVLDRYRQVELLIELKPHGGALWTARLLAAICRQIRLPEVRERVQLLCFNSGVLRAAQAAAPRLRLVRNCTDLPVSRAKAWISAHAFCHAIDPLWSAWNPSLVAHARAQGLRTYAYTVNRVPELRRLAQLGVDAVISNRPAWARDWLRDGQGDGQGDGQRDWLRADG
jgi:glycerophosphoryl diester phosphodiesterase